MAPRRELGSRIEVESHIEPQPERLLEGQEAAPKVVGAITKALTTLAARQKRLSGLHNIRIRHNENGIFVHYHCRFDGSDTVDAVHDDVDRIGAVLQGKFPNIRRVIAHTEPLARVRHKP